MFEIVIVNAGNKGFKPGVVAIEYIDCLLVAIRSLFFFLQRSTFRIFGHVLSRDRGVANRFMMDEKNNEEGWESRRA